MKIVARADDGLVTFLYFATPEDAAACGKTLRARVDSECMSTVSLHAMYNLPVCPARRDVIRYAISDQLVLAPRESSAVNKTVWLARIHALVRDEVFMLMATALTGSGAIASTYQQATGDEMEAIELLVACCYRQRGLRLSVNPVAVIE